MTVKHDRVRLYHQLRSAHLERAAQLPPATIVYQQKRYDFQDSLAKTLHLVQAKGWRAALYTLRHPISVLEVNEPLMLLGVRTTAAGLVGLKLRELLGGERARVVTYAIENLEPALLPQPVGLKHRAARRLDTLFSRLIWRRLDRIAYGTSAAHDLYQSALGRSAEAGPDALVIPALPAPADDAQVSLKQPLQVLFLGAFAERKGFPLVMEAWAQVVRQVPGARLTVVGKGPLQHLADDAAAAENSIEVVVDPPRGQIRDLLRVSQILVLASQSSPGWREQVGLPIVEALSYGCTVVTTTETGLASWLAEHGHWVVDAPTSPRVLGEAMVAALRQPLDAHNVLASLPDQDRRLAADAWLFGPEATLTTHG